MNTVTPEALPALFASPAALRHGFEDGLEAMLEHDLLGVFILVLANAGFEAATFERLRRPLHAAYRRWCARFDADDPAVRNAAADDVAVFRRLRESGFDNLSCTRWRTAGPWQIQFNPLRALRPPRMSDAVVDCLAHPFDTAAFHFNKPFLEREILWEGRLCDVPMRLLYNKFPFAELHGLLVPEPLAQRPQLLRAADHALLWDVCRELGAGLPGVGFGYNAYGAYASVNHLHFQMYARSAGEYPVESTVWRHNGGSTDYPTRVDRFDDADSAWARLARLHAGNRAYNLLYRPGCLYVAERRMQGGYRHSAWTSGFAWSELAGAVTTFDENVFMRLQASDVADEMRRLAPAQ